MKYNNEDLEKAKLYEIIDAGIDPRENIIFQMLFSKKGNEDLLQDFLTEEYNRGEEIGEARGKAEGKTEERIKIIKKLLKSGMNTEKISCLIDVPVSKVKRISML